MTRKTHQLMRARVWAVRAGCGLLMLSAGCPVFTREHPEQRPDPTVQQPTTRQPTNRPPVKQLPAKNAAPTAPPVH